MRSPRFGRGKGRAGRSRLLAGLTARQAGITLLVAVALGLLASGVELVSEWYAVRQDAQRTAQQWLALASESATEAAFQMNPTLGKRVVAGLVEQETLRKVTLRDNFGGVLGEWEREGSVAAEGSLADRMFGDIAHYSVPLVHTDTDQEADVLGHLDVWLDARRLTDRFLGHMAIMALAEMTRAAIICAVMIVVFHFMTTRPLLGMAAGVTRIEAGRPGARLLPVPSGHRTDELGLLIGTVNDLLKAFQHGLDERDRAQSELTELARHLERRVVERTRDLEQARDELAREKDELERALAELNKASRFIDESIWYARRIQLSLLPQPGALDGSVHDMAVGWFPRDAVGGDYYWLERRDDVSLIVLMDCTGHGIPGAFMTAIAASALARILGDYCHDDPARILAMIDDLVRTSLRQDGGDTISDDGLDAAVCVIDHRREVLTYAGANIPLFVQSEGRVSRVRGDRRGLGHRSAAPSAGFSNHEIPLTPGSAFFLCTDGLTDQIGGDLRRSFGQRRLRERLEATAGLPPARQMDVVLEALTAYRGSEIQRDDMTFLGIRPLAPSGTRHAA